MVKYKERNIIYTDYYDYGVIKIRLIHNLESLNVFREHNKVLQRQSSAIEKISSGYKINNAKDNPNAIANSEKNEN